MPDLTALRTLAAPCAAPLSVTSCLASPSSVSASPWRIARTLPSRTTATRLQCLTRSPSRCVTRRTMRPVAAILCISRKSSSDSSAVSAELGSSKRKTRAIAGYGTGDLGALLGGQRAIGQLPVFQMSDTKRIHDLRVGSAKTRFGGVRALAADHHVLCDGEIGKKLRLLMHNSHRMPVDRRRPGLAVEGQCCRYRVAPRRQ